MRQTRLSLPAEAIPAGLVQPDRGIAAIRTRWGSEQLAPFTILDTPDLRLIEAGLILGHRVVDDSGEWVLLSSGWEPYLAPQIIEPLGHGDVPESLSALLRPFRRLAALGVVGELSGERRGYTAVNDSGDTLVSLTDEILNCEVQSNAVESIRIVTVTDVAASKAQFLDVVAGLEAVGGRRLPAGDPIAALLSDRYGVGDFRFPDRFTVETTMRTFASGALRRRIRRIIESDLAFRKNIDGEPDIVNLQLLRAQRTVEGISWASSADTDGLIADLQWLLEHQGSAPFGERYLRVLDDLVTLARAPKLGEWEERSAFRAMAQEIDASLTAVVDRAGRLDRHSPRIRWEKTRAALLHCLALTRVSRKFFGSRAKGLRRRLEMIVSELDACLPVVPPTPSLEGLPAKEAFEAGRAFERATIGAEAARVQFVANWPDHRRYFKRLGIKP